MMHLCHIFYCLIYLLPGAWIAIGIQLHCDVMRTDVTGKADRACCCWLSAMES